MKRNIQHIYIWSNQMRTRFGLLVLGTSLLVGSSAIVAIGAIAAINGKRSAAKRAVAR